MSLAFLSPEIYGSIISHFEEQDVSHTILSLTRALPYAPIPLHDLFTNVRIKEPVNLIQFYQRLRRSDEGEQAHVYVRNFALKSWNVDPEVLLDVLHMLPNIESLTLWIGPLNFAPEHLEELLDVSSRRHGARHLICVDKLSRLMLRFKPYVEKATYHNFLKGSYFDDTLYALSRWPKTKLPTLSIVQDPFDEEVGNGKIIRRNELGFAQPIVFFKVEPALPILLRSPTIRQSLISFSFQLPARNTTRSFTHPPPPNPPSFGPSRKANESDSEEEAERIRQKYTHDSANLSAAPYLNFLDLSTSSIPASSIPLILTKFPSIQHLVMDGCKLLLGDLAVTNDGGEWAALAKTLVLAGVLKAQERQKKVEAFVERLRALKEGPEDGNEASTSTGSTQQKKTRKGRKGLAIATISLRKEDEQPVSINLRDTKKAQLRMPNGEPSQQHILSSRRVRVLPPLPTLRTFCTTLVPPTIHPAASSAKAREKLIETIQDKWEEGWAEGVAQLVNRRKLMHTSWRNQTARVLRFAEVTELVLGQGPDDDDAFGDTEEGLDGLVDIVEQETFDVDVSGDSPCGKAPVLCFAGNDTFDPDKKALHVEGCGHSVAWDAWR